jgi:UDP-N-acetylmuramate--alanine ligase
MGTLFGKVRKLHFVGIGGIGMSGIAEVLLNLDFQISGSDLQLSEVTQHLEKIGATISEGHRANQVGDADAVVISSAVRSDNPEVMEARRRKIPVIRRAEMLGELMRMKYGIGIAGTHGKTTTTSMTSLVLDRGGLDPTVIVGGKVKSLRTSAKLGQGQYLVAEADEFDRSFLRLLPTIAVVTTLEAEHLDCYTNLDDIKGAFIEYVNKVPFYGAVVICLDEDSLQSIIPHIHGRLITYGLSPQAHIRAVELEFQGLNSSFNVIVGKQKMGRVTLRVPGIHNVKNGLAALAVGLEVGLEFESVRKSLEAFSGVYRRFEVKGEVGGVMVVDDYAHHPTEIQATLLAAKEGLDRRTIAVFQPHLYSRTRDFYDDFGKSFFHSDMLLVTDVYPAREQPIAGVSGELVARAAREHGHGKVVYIEDKNKVATYLAAQVQPDDLVITLGAGDVYRIGERLLTLLGKRRST